MLPGMLGTSLNRSHKRVRISAGNRRSAEGNTAMKESDVWRLWRAVGAFSKACLSFVSTESAEEKGVYAWKRTDLCRDR